MADRLRDAIGGGGEDGGAAAPQTPEGAGGGADAAGAGGSQSASSSQLSAFVCTTKFIDKNNCPEVRPNFCFVFQPSTLASLHDTWKDGVTLSFSSFDSFFKLG